MQPVPVSPLPPAPVVPVGRTRSRSSRRRHSLVRGAWLLCAGLTLIAAESGQAQRAAPFTLEQVMSYPFPADLVASPAGDRLAWTFVTNGVRSLWVAEGPDYRARALVSYTPEDGQELSGLAFSGDGRHVVYVRGGDHGSNWAAERNLLPNPTSSPVQPKLQIWAAALSGGAPVLIADGDAPAPSPKDDRIAFEREDAIWVAPIDGSTPATRLFFARGRNGAPTWSPDGRTLAFVSARGSLGYIGLYSGDDRPIRYLSPAASLDEAPRWSPDGQRIAFVRRPGRGGPAASPLQWRHQPWALWVADVATDTAREVWRSPDTRWGAYPRTQGDANLAWGAGDRLVFLSYEDGWPHLYAVPTTTGAAGSGGGGGSSSSRGGGAAATAPARATLLTPGSFMVEFVSLTPDRKFAIYNANTGPDKDDIERRHLFKVAVDAATPTPVPLTRGTGLEWSPVVTASGSTLAYFGATAQSPGLPFVRPLDAPVENAAASRALVSDQIRDFPASALVTPEHVVFKAADGTAVHGQLFKPADANASNAGGGNLGGGSGGGSAGARVEARKPALIFVHGGPPRQMLLGWHYRYYYANSYAVNQYLASRGFLVLSVNYRLGIGYGFDFHYPADGGARGAGEYQDVVAGARYLQARRDVDPKRIGIWGGSYGGYLTALALARNSDLFAAGVDIHGVHNWGSQGSGEALEAAALVGDGVTRAQLDEAARVSWASSPVSSIATWKSPVLLIHGDDDRNVRVDQTVDLARRLKAAGVPFEEIVIPDDIHDFLLHRNWLRVNQATAEFFERRLKPASAGTGSR